MTYTPIPFGQQGWDVPLNAALTDQDQRITTTQNDLVASGGAVDVLEAEFNATDHGFLTWAYDPNLATAGSAALTSGTLYLHKIKVTSTAITNSIRYAVNTAAITPVAGQNFVALFDNTGTQVAISADIGSTDFASTGLKNTPWVSPAVVSAGYYYAAILTNAATGVNVWKSTGGQAILINANLSNANLRSSSGGTGLTGLTAVPASVTMANRGSGANNFWFALQ